MRTTWGVVRGLVCALVVLGTACGDNIRVGGGEVAVTPAQGLRTNETGGTATFTVALTSPPVGTLTVDLTSSNTAEGTVEPARLTFDGDNFDVAQTITITGVDDDVADGNEDYSIEVAAEMRDAMSVAVTNDDDDMARVQVTPSTGLITTKQGGTASFDVVLTSRPSSSVTVPLSSNNTAQGTIDKANLTFT